MEYRTRNVFEQSNLIKLSINKTSKNKELNQKKERIVYNQRHSKIINFILFEITLIIFSKINSAFGLTIEIKVNQEGENQIISDNYNGTLPKIYINNSYYNITKIIDVQNITDNIELIWEDEISDFSYLFYNLENITYFKLNHTPANNIINMTKMFYNCKNITTIIFDIGYNRIPIEFLPTNYRTIYYYLPDDLSYAFYNCISLTDLQLYYLKTDSTKEIKYMFFNCNQLETISFIDCYFTNKLITNMKGIFQNCESLTSLNLTTFKTDNVIIMWDMFKNCKKLSTLNLSTFFTNEVTDME